MATSKSSRALPPVTVSSSRQVPVPSIPSLPPALAGAILVGLLLLGGAVEALAQAPTGSSGFLAPTADPPPLAGEAFHLPGPRVGDAGHLPAFLRGEHPVDDAWSDPLEGHVTPRGAFLRSLLVPGWGHVEAGAPTRAAFYVAAQGGSWWMLGRSMVRRAEARRTVAWVRDEVRAELMAQGVSSPDSLRLALDADPRVERWDELVEIRGEQVEDWVALGLFLTLLSATDALVAAHMADYPDPLTFVVAPLAAPGGGWGVGIRVPAQWPAFRRSSPGARVPLP
jgi:hypothetical protein